MKGWPCANQDICQILSHLAKKGGKFFPFDQIFAVLYLGDSVLWHCCSKCSNAISFLCILLVVFLPVCHSSLCLSRGLLLLLPAVELQFADWSFPRRSISFLLLLLLPCSVTDAHKKGRRLFLSARRRTREWGGFSKKEGSLSSLFSSSFSSSFLSMSNSTNSSFPPPFSLSPAPFLFLSCCFSTEWKVSKLCHIEIARSYINMARCVFFAKWFNSSAYSIFACGVERSIRRCKKGERRMAAWNAVEGKGGGGWKRQESISNRMGHEEALCFVNASSIFRTDNIFQTFYIFFSLL